MKRMRSGIQICPPENCTGCGSCLQKCPKQCISMIENSEGFRYPVINPGVCVRCGICIKSCPAARGYHLKADLKKPLFFGARLPSRERRLESTSGGIFRGLSDYILQQEKGVIGGVRFGRNFEPDTALADSPSGRDEFCKSKYVQAKNDEAYALAAAHLEAGRTVFFTGTPCLVAGLYAYLGGDMPNLYTMDFICHGAPSPLVFRNYLRAMEKKYGGPATKICFRDKSSGWVPMRFTIQFQNGRKYSETNMENPYFRYFLAGGISRESCYRCPWTRIHGREADISAGDGWNIPKHHGEWNDNSGISSVIVNTEKGMVLLKKSSKYIECTECTLSEVDQGYLHRPGKPHPDRKEFFLAMEKDGVLAAFEKYAGSRPFFRRLKTRVRKILRKLGMFLSGHGEK